MKRFFVNHGLGKDFDLTGTEHNHLTNVLRTKTGEHVVVCCDDEYDYIYEAVKITKNSTQMRFIQHKPNTANPKIELDVFMALIKPDNINLVMQKLNELGVSVLTLFNSAHAQQKMITRDKIDVFSERLRKIAEQSSKQCRRSIPLFFHDILTFDEMCDCAKNSDLVIFADETETDTKIANLNIKPDKNISLIIGPEGGFTEIERRQIRAMKNIVSVSLGKRILRTETATIAASAIILSKLGEL